MKKMMFENLWTQDEIDMLYTDMTTDEIAEKTHRTREAVESKRYKITGHYVEASKQRESYQMVFIPPVMSKTQKVARIIALADQLGVKLGRES